MTNAKIDVRYEATLTVHQEGIVHSIRKSLHHNWVSVEQGDSPFSNYNEKMDCWYSEPSSIYIGVFDKDTNRERKYDVVFLHVYPNIPMWNMKKEIKEVIKEIGAINPEIILPSYIVAVASGALQLLEYT